MLSRDLSQSSLGRQKTHEKGDRATSGKLKPVFAGMLLFQGSPSKLWRPGRWAARQSDGGHDENEKTCSSHKKRQSEAARPVGVRYCIGPGVRNPDAAENVIDPKITGPCPV